MNAEWLVEMLLEGDDEQRAELLNRLKEEGYELVDEVNTGDYDLILWRGHKTRYDKPVEFYEMSLNRKGLDFTSSDSQAGRQSGGSTRLAGKTSRMLNAVRGWLRQYGTLYVGSHNERKLRIYQAVMKKELPDMAISNTFKAFDDSEVPDYFTIGSRQMALPLESVNKVLLRVLGKAVV